jgi:hypothetical protein
MKISSALLHVQYDGKKPYYISEPRWRAMVSQIKGLKNEIDSGRAYLDNRSRLCYN